MAITIDDVFTAHEILTTLDDTHDLLKTVTITKEGGVTYNNGMTEKRFCELAEEVIPGYIGIQEPLIGDHYINKYNQE